MGFDSGRGFTSAGGSSGGQGEIGGTLPVGTEGQVLYFDGTTNLWTATSNVFIDDTNNRVGIGITSSLLAKLHVKSASGTAFQVDTSTRTSVFKVDNDNSVRLFNLEFTQPDPNLFHQLRFVNNNGIRYLDNGGNIKFIMASDGRLFVNNNNDLVDSGNLYVMGATTSDVNIETVAMFYKDSTNKNSIRFRLSDTVAQIRAINNLNLVTYDSISNSYINNLRLVEGKHNVSTINTTALADGSHENSEMSFWVDEAGNTLNFKVKYSGGTVKSGSVALV